VRIPFLPQILITAALAGPALAKPRIRWIDATGEVRNAVVAKTISEEKGIVLVEFADGKAASIRFQALLEWIREDETKAEQMTLLDARMRVRAGVRLKGVAKELDHLAQKGSEPWIREYALAARTILAVRQKSPDATKLSSKFKKSHASSRFLAELMLASAEISAETAEGAKAGLGRYLTAFRKIHKLGGPLRVQFRCFDGCARFNAQHSWEKKTELITLLRAPVQTLYPNKGILVSTVELSTESDMLLVLLDFQAANARKAGLSLNGIASQYRKLSDNTELCLPATRAAPWFRLGEIELETGTREMARKYFKRARELDPSWELRYRVEAALAQAPAGK
jgi:hypothetical protein